MHICHIITRLIVGGAQENTVLTCRGLVERGHRVTLLAGPETGPEGTLWDKASTVGCKLVECHHLRRAINPIADWRARRELTRLLRRLQPDIVHTHSSKAGILGRMAAAAAGVPIIVHTIHGMSFNRTQSVFVRGTYRMLERRAARSTAALVTVADAMIEQSVSAGIAPRQRFVTIRSGIETDRFGKCEEQRQRYRRSWGIAADEVVVGTIARLFSNKGYDEIIDAMPGALSRHANLRFVWIGDGHHRSRYEQRLADLGLRDRVTMTGLVRPDEIPGMINGFDMLVHASRWEGLPRSVVESLLTEVPAISYDNDGAPEVVRDGETGLLVPMGSVEGLADAIARLTADPADRHAMGRLGRERCVQEFDWRCMVEQLESLYVDLARRNHDAL